MEFEIERIIKGRCLGLVLVLRVRILVIVCMEGLI